MGVVRCEEEEGEQSVRVIPKRVDVHAVRKDAIPWTARADPDPENPAHGHRMSGVLDGSREDFLCFSSFLNSLKGKLDDDRRAVEDRCWRKKHGRVRIIIQLRMMSRPNKRQSCRSKRKS